MEKVAALIYFKEGVDIERVKAWVAKLNEIGVTDGVADIRSYDSEYGDPCWYIP